MQEKLTIIGYKRVGGPCMYLFHDCDLYNVSQKKKVNIVFGITLSNFYQLW